MDLKLYCLLTSTCIFYLSGVAALRWDETHVYTFAYMNITGDDPTLPIYQEFFVSSWNSTRFRVQMPLKAVDAFEDISSKNQFYERAFTVDLSSELSRSVIRSAARVVANASLSVQAVKGTTGSTDGFLVLPLTAESTEFYIPSYANIPEGHSTFLVASVYDDTCVSAYYIKNGGQDKVRIFFLSLGEFEVYQSYSDLEDYTGVYVEASRPVAVFGGHECSQIPTTALFCDHLVEQVPPVSEWGREFIVGPIVGRKAAAGYQIRVLAATQNTLITVTDAAAATRYTRQRGEYLDYDVTDADAITAVECDVPCLVTQYNRGYRATPGDTNTDPYMVVIPPLDHYSNFMTFSTAKYWHKDHLEIFKSYLTIIIRTGDIGGILLNDNTISLGFRAWRHNQGPVGGYSVVSLDVAHGNYTLRHSDPSVTLMGILYGHSGLIPTAYGYPVGYDMKGSSIPGAWWPSVLEPPPTQPPDTCTRPLPPASIRVYDLIIDINQRLKFPALGSCIKDYKDYIFAKVDDVKDRINYLICIGQMCQGTTWCQITSLKAVRFNDESLSRVESVDFVITVANAVDEIIGDVLECKQAIAAYIKEKRNFGLAAPINGCSDLDFDDQEPIVSHKWQCLGEYSLQLSATVVNEPQAMVALLGVLLFFTCKI